MSTDLQSLAEALHEAQGRLRAGGIDEAELEAEVLLRHALSVSREQLFARLNSPLPREQRQRFESLLTRRLAREPAAYIVGRKEFYGLELACTPSALIPRPETELIVELALEWVRGQGSRVKEPRVLDVGTGNGAIAIAIAVHAPQVRVVAVDLERPALLLARRNAEAHGVAGRIDFVQGSLLEPLRGRFDVIVANLPYVPTRLFEALPPEIREHEPEPALHAGAEGTEVIEELLAQAPALLAPRDRRAGLRLGGQVPTRAYVLAEHAWDQGARLREVAAARFPGARLETHRDLAGHERVLVVEAGARV